DGIDHLGRKLTFAAGKRLRPRDGDFNHLRLVHDFSVLLVIGVGNGLQHALETGTPIVVVRREIGAAVKRLAVWREKRGQRPTTLSADGAHRHLITAVDVGTLVAIHFHRDKALIHN